TSDWVSQAQEALWSSGEEYGRRLEAADQVALARELARSGPHTVTSERVRSAFAAVGLPAPPSGLVRSLVVRINQLRPRPSLTEVLLSFRRDAIRNLSRQYGGRPKPEDELRRHLL